MQLFVLVGQRKQRYEGEYQPEALEVIDENGNDENPDFMQGKRQEAIKSGDFDSVAVVRIKVPWNAITESLYPAVREIAGSVI